MVAHFAYFGLKNGRIAQLEERLPYTQEVTGSSPVPPTNEINKLDELFG